MGTFVCDPTRGDHGEHVERLRRWSAHPLGAGAGDRLLVRRVSRPQDVRTGDVVLARFPARPELLVVKRVRRAVPAGHWVEGDNPLVADDSRAFGPAVVVGRVVVRLWPRPHRLPAPPDVPG